MNTVAVWADRGRIPCATQTPGGHRRYRAADVERLRVELGRPAVPPPPRTPHPPPRNGRNRGCCPPARSPPWSTSTSAPSAAGLTRGFSRRPRSPRAVIADGDLRTSNGSPARAAWPKWAGLNGSAGSTCIIIGSASTVSDWVSLRCVRGCAQGTHARLPSAPPRTAHSRRSPSVLRGRQTTKTAAARWQLGDPSWLTAREAAQALGITVRWMNVLARDGWLPFERSSSGRQLFRPDQVAALDTARRSWGLKVRRRQG